MRWIDASDLSTQKILGVEIDRWRCKLTMLENGFFPKTFKFLKSFTGTSAPGLNANC